MHEPNLRTQILLHPLVRKCLLVAGVPSDGPLVRHRNAPFSDNSCTGYAHSLQAHESTDARHMNFIICLVVGGLIGWVASMLMKTDAQQGVILNVVVGIVGAMLGGWLLAPMFGTGTINSNDFSLAGLGVSLLGAIVLLAIVSFFRRGSAR